MGFTLKALRVNAGLDQKEAAEFRFPAKHPCLPDHLAEMPSYRVQIPQQKTP